MGEEQLLVDMVNVLDFVLSAQSRPSERTAHCLLTPARYPSATGPAGCVLYPGAGGTDLYRVQVVSEQGMCKVAGANPTFHPAPRK